MKIRAFWLGRRWTSGRRSRHRHHRPRGLTMHETLRDLLGCLLDAAVILGMALIVSVIFLR